MTAATWARSPQYGSVVLGPAQASTLAAIHSLTGAGRRPFVTLGRLSTMTGRPISSVHSAVGRLRALGLIGAVATMGRHGGLRLWRPSMGARLGGRVLDSGRHRRAVARIIAMTSDRRPTDTRAAPTARALWQDDELVPDAPAAVPGSPPARTGPSFGESMRRAGFTPWWRSEDEHGDRSAGDPDGSDRA